MSTRCFNCRKTDLERFEDEVRLDVDLANGPLTFTVTGVPATRCRSCGETWIAAAELQRAELRAAAELADRGLHEGAAFKFMRKALGLRAADVAELFDVTPEMVSHWENDRTPADNGAWAALAAMISDRAAGTSTTADRLRAARKPRASSGPILLRFVPG